MKLSFRTFQVALALALALCISSKNAIAAEIYVLSDNEIGNSGSSMNFGKIDTSTGTYTNISTIASLPYALAWVDSAQAFYTTDVFNGSSFAPLKTISLSGTLSASIGNSTGAAGMAYRTSNSTMYMFDWNNKATATVNLANGAVSQLNASSGIFPQAPVGGRYAIHNGILFVSFYNYNNNLGYFGTIGYTASSTFSTITTNNLFQYMSLVSDGTTLYGLYGDGTNGQQRLYTINTSTGVATPGAFISGTGLGTVFHGAGIVPVPEPSTYALGAIASGMIALIARRRKANRNG